VDWPVIFLALFAVGAVIGVCARADFQKRAEARRRGVPYRPPAPRRTKRSGWRCCGRMQWGAYCARCKRPAPKWTTPDSPVRKSTTADDLTTEAGEDWRRAIAEARRMLREQQQDGKTDDHAS
jgi:hypothetical protein